MRCWRQCRLTVLCLLLAAPLYAAPRKSLPARIDAVLAEPDLARGFWGIEVVSLSTGKVLYDHNADKLFTPASNTKLFTTAAALALIGPDYTSAPRSKPAACSTSTDASPAI